MPPRRSGAETREAIAAAAGALFTERGFAGTSVRDIAAAARTDPALVIRHFGSKELLFLEAVHPDLQDQPLLEAPLEHLGERLVRFVLDLDGPRRGAVLALVRGGSEPAIAVRLRESHESAFVAPLRARLAQHTDGRDAEVRARLAAALVGGLLYALWVVQDAALLALPREELVARYGALLQGLLVPERPAAP